MIPHRCAAGAGRCAIRCSPCRPWPHCASSIRRRAVLGDLAADARRRAQISWAQNKGVLAAYWKAVGAYATHIRRALLS
jgi:hypothetical protein